MSKMQLDNRDKHTEVIQDFIEIPPAWLLRWGITIVFFLIISALSLSYLIKYPDFVKGTIKIQFVDNPTSVMIERPGRLTELFVENGQEVKINQALASIQTLYTLDTLKSSKTGTVTYAGLFHNNQQVAAKQKIFYLTDNRQGFYGELPISSAKVSKIKVGQSVIVKLRMYSYREYGALQGTIKYIAFNPSAALEDQQYIAEIEFKKGNVTDTNKKLQLSSGMVADGEIITQDRSLLKRLIDNITDNFTIATIIF